MTAPAGGGTQHSRHLDQEIRRSRFPGASEHDHQARDTRRGGADCYRSARRHAGLSCPDVEARRNRVDERSGGAVSAGRTNHHPLRRHGIQLQGRARHRDPVALTALRDVVPTRLHGHGGMSQPSVSTMQLVTSSVSPDASLARIASLSGFGVLPANRCRLINLCHDTAALRRRAASRRSANPIRYSDPLRFRLSLRGTVASSHVDRFVAKASGRNWTARG